MFWLSYERWNFAGFGGFWYKSCGRTTGVGVQAGNRLPRIMCPLLDGTMNILVTRTASETLDSYPQSSSVNYISIRYPLQIANLYVKPFWGRAEISEQ
jgi:hypothetical protein